MKVNNKTTDNKIKSNILNYGIYCVGFITVYIVLALIIQTVFGLSDIAGTAIVNIVMLCLSICLSCKRAYKQQVPSFQTNNNCTVKNIMVWYLYVVMISYSCLTFFNWIELHFVDNTMSSRSDSFSNMSVLAILGYSVILAPIFEECMMRLFMYNQLKRSSHICVITWYNIAYYNWYFIFYSVDFSL